MACYHPLSGYRYADGTIRHIERQGVTGLVTIKCGQCIGCRLERSKMWAIRCMHEAQMHDKNSFITLTYDDENLPEHGTLVLDHFQKFMKRLRKHLKQKKVRFFHCGEYGEKLRRPHYHACLFGVEFPDKKLWKIRGEERYYTSEVLNKLWGKGYCVIGDVTFESAAYVARYITKKITGRQARSHYESYNYDTGEVFDRKPEYTTMSRRPGIAKAWFTEYQKDVYPHDHVIIKGKELQPPKYYDSQYELIDPEGLEQIKFTRREKAKKHLENNTKARLQVREEIQMKKFKQLKRSYENET